RALELARASGADDTVIGERARVAFRDAGERRSSLGAFGAATRSFRQALELWPAADQERPALMLQLARSRYWSEQAGRDEAMAAGRMVRGQTRIVLGDLGGVEDVERALVSVNELRSPFEPIFAGNSAVTLFDLGQLPRAFELIAQGRGAATRFGNRPMLEWLDV